jgi:hypothetical protein
MTSSGLEWPSSKSLFNLSPESIFMLRSLLTKFHFFSYVKTWAGSMEQKKVLLKVG